MKSKIIIDIDEDNQPILRVDYFPSEDTRDKLVKKFLETFGGASCWARFRYLDIEYSDESYPKNRKAIIRPIPESKLNEEVDEIRNLAKAYEKYKNTEAPTS